MFSRERIMSILMLLAILIISLVFASYREGLSGIEDVNKEAPKADADASKGPNALPKDGILLGKPSTLTVAEITGALKNNPGVQNLIDNKKK